MLQHLWISCTHYSMYVCKFLHPATIIFLLVFSSMKYFTMLKATGNILGAICGKHVLYEMYVRLHITHTTHTTHTHAHTHTHTHIHNAHHINGLAYIVQLHSPLTTIALRHLSG